MTEIYDYLRLLYARTGTPYCPDHPDQALESQTVSQMVDTVLALPEGTRLMILAPVVTGRKGEHVDLFENLQAQGFVRVRVRTGGMAGAEGVGGAAAGGASHGENPTRGPDPRTRKPADAQQAAEAFDRRGGRPRSR